MSTDSLNLFGQAALTAAASIAVNGVSHPLGTIETLCQVQQAIPWLGSRRLVHIPIIGNAQVRIPFVELYRGFYAVCGVEALSFGIAYTTNDVFKERLGPIGAIVAAAGVSTPFIGIGEGAMKNRQANNLSYCDRVLWQQSMRLPGLAVTFKRELIWNLGIFYATPRVTEQIHHLWPNCHVLAGQVIAATITGATVGFVTTPIAGIKTVIQTSKDELSIVEAFRKLTISNEKAEETTVQKILRSTQIMFRGGLSRVGYLSVSMCMMNLVYQNLPSYLPDMMRKD